MILEMFLNAVTLYLIKAKNLEDVVSRCHISNIYPLAVDVGIVSVVTPWTQALEIQQQYTFSSCTCKMVTVP